MQKTTSPAERRAAGGNRGEGGRLQQRCPQEQQGTEGDVVRGAAYTSQGARRVGAVQGVRAPGGGAEPPAPLRAAGGDGPGAARGGAVTAERSGAERGGGCVPTARHEYRHR